MQNLTPELIFRGLFVLAYLIALVCYFFSETSGDLPRRVCNKMIMATMFLVYGAVEFFRLSGSPFDIHLLGMAALVFAWLGDLYLLFSFITGGIIFMVSNVLYSTYQLYLLFSNGVSPLKLWWCLLLFLVLNGIVWFCFLTKRIDFGNKKIFLLYIATTTFMGCSALGLAVYQPSLRWIMFGAGIALYMISDYFLMLHVFKYKEKKWILRVNSATYFIGMLLVALSYSLIA